MRRLLRFISRKRYRVEWFTEPGSMYALGLLTRLAIVFELNTRISEMTTLRAFDQALADSARAHGAAWINGVQFVGALAAKLTDAEFALLRVIWLDRPPLWQKHCADVLDQTRSSEALGLLMDMVDRAGPDVSRVALESLSKFDPELFSPKQTTRLLAAIDAALARPVGSLHQALLEKFQARLRSPGLGAG